MHIPDSHKLFNQKLMVLVAALSLAAASQAVPAQFSYQGVLHDSAGAPMSGPQQVELRLYDVASGSKSALWGRTYAVQLDANGLFNIEVSDTTGTAISGEQYDQLASVFATTNTLYIGLKVNGSSEARLIFPSASTVTNFLYAGA